VGNVRTILYFQHISIFSSDCVQYRKLKQQHTTTCKLKNSVIGTRHLKGSLFLKMNAEQLYQREQTSCWEERQRWNWKYRFYFKYRIRFIKLIKMSFIMTEIILRTNSITILTWSLIVQQRLFCKTLSIFKISENDDKIINPTTA